MRSRPHVLLLASDELFPTFFAHSLLARLQEIADWERRRERSDSPELRAAIARSEALITTWDAPRFSAEMLEGSPVRLIVHCGGEVKAKIEEAVFERVTVANTPEPMAAPVAEMAMAMILSLVRRLPHYERAMRAGMAPEGRMASEGETLAGRRVGIVGFGRVGRELASRLLCFGAEVVAADPYGSRAAAEASGVKLVDIDELLHSSSVVALTAALTPETRGILDAKRLTLLPRGACLVNVARGGLVDLDALTAELRSGRLRAALDVTDPLEPLPQDHELRRLPNVLLTPHVAGGGIEVRRAMGESAIDQLDRFFQGERPTSVVTREMLARMT